MSIVSERVTPTASGITTRPIPRVLSIAGTDPSGGAGIQADLKSIAANGGYGMAAVTALVAQNTQGVRSVHVPPTTFLREQLDAVSDDVAIDAIKIGMLANSEVIAVVRDWLGANRAGVVVLDPVMVASSGDRLLDADAEAGIRSLLPFVDLITPNLAELAVLAETEKAAGWDDAIAQALSVSERFAVAVLVTGGHLAGDVSPDALVDATGQLTGGDTVVEFSGERIQTRNTHGTGCSLSSAIATLAASGGDWAGAVSAAKSWLTEGLRSSDELEVGSGMGPINHFATLWASAPGAARTDPTALADTWWAASADDRTAIDELDFITGLAEGTLDPDVFRSYLAQDTLYLRGYARVLAEASRLAPTDEEQAFWAQSAHGSIVAEQEVHNAWLGKGHADPEPTPVTTAYLNHLAAAAFSGEYAVIVAAVLPCFWIYQDVGERLLGHSHPGHPYAAWLDSYADPAFAESTRTAITLASAAASTARPDVRAAADRAFAESARHELAFFAEPLLLAAGRDSAG